MILILKGRNDSCYGRCSYENGLFVVKAGSKIRKEFSEHIVGGTYSKKYRNNEEYVNADGVVIKDCVFNSSSTAAQFITGRSTNGLLAWKNEEGRKLKELL